MNKSFEIALRWCEASDLAEQCAGVFCMAYRQSVDVMRNHAAVIDTTVAEIAAQAAVEAFLETLTR
jgi:hypothetical protein